MVELLSKEKALNNFEKLHKLELKRSWKMLKSKYQKDILIQQKFQFLAFSFFKNSITKKFIKFAKRFTNKKSKIPQTRVLLTALENIARLKFYDYFSILQQYIPDDSRFQQSNPSKVIKFNQNYIQNLKELNFSQITNDLQKNNFHGLLSPLINKSPNSDFTSTEKPFDKNTNTEKSKTNELQKISHFKEIKKSFDTEDYRCERTDISLNETKDRTPLRKEKNIENIFESKLVNEKIKTPLFNNLIEPEKELFSKNREHLNSRYKKTQRTPSRDSQSLLAGKFLSNTVARYGYESNDKNNHKRLLQYVEMIKRQITNLTSGLTQTNQQHVISLIQKLDQIENILKTRDEITEEQSQSIQLAVDKICQAFQLKSIDCALMKQQSIIAKANNDLLLSNQHISNFNNRYQQVSPNINRSKLSERFNSRGNNFNNFTSNEIGDRPFKDLNIRSIDYSNSNDNTEKWNSTMVFSPRTADLINLAVVLNLILQKKTRNLVKKSFKEFFCFAENVFKIGRLKRMFNCRYQKFFVESFEKVRFFQKRKKATLADLLFRLSKSYKSIFKLMFKFLAKQNDETISRLAKHCGPKMFERLKSKKKVTKISKVYSPVLKSIRIDYFTMTLEKPMSEFKEDDYFNFNPDQFYMNLEKEYEGKNNRQVKRG